MWRLALLAVCLLTTPAVAQTLSVSPSAASSSALPVVTFSNGPTQAGEWLSIHLSATPTVANVTNWQWMTGGQGTPPSGGVTSGNVTFPFNHTMADGTYRAVWWSSSNQILAQSETFSWGGSPPPCNCTVMQPTLTDYVNIRSLRWAQAFYHDNGQKIRSPWIKNTTEYAVEIRIPINGGVAPSSQLNAVIYVRSNDTDEPGERVGHENNATFVTGSSEHNTSPWAILLPGQSYWVDFAYGTPERWYERALPFVLEAAP